MMTMHMFWVLMVMMGFFVLVLGGAMVAVRILAGRDKEKRPRR